MIERYSNRDLTINNWHWGRFGTDAHAFDVDLVGVCHRAACREPLYVIEATSVKGEKSLRWAKTAAQAMGVPGYIVRHDAQPRSGRCPACQTHLYQAARERIWPTPASIPMEVHCFTDERRIGGEYELWRRLIAERLMHDVEHHREEYLRRLDSGHGPYFPAWSRERRP